MVYIKYTNIFNNNINGGSIKKDRSFYKNFYDNIHDTL